MFVAQLPATDVGRPLGPGYLPPPVSDRRPSLSIPPASAAHTPDGERAGLRIGEYVARAEGPDPRIGGQRDTGRRRPVGERAHAKGMVGGKGPAGRAHRGAHDRHPGRSHGGHWEYASNPIRWTAPRTHPPPSPKSAPGRRPARRPYPAMEPT